MGELVFSGLSPHPPILVPEIGKEELEKCAKSRDGMRTLSRMLAASKPDILVLITPHGPTFYDALSIYTSRALHGDFSRFGAPDVKVEIPGHPSLAGKILSAAKNEKIPALDLNEETYARYKIPPALDHATMVPLYYFKEAGLNVPLVLISIGFLPYPDLFRFGRCVADAIAQEKRRVAVIASGDLSHRLIPSAPAGYDPIGKEFDATMIELLKRHDAQGILRLDAELIERAGECGFRPILIMLGATQNMALKKDLISYEGPFGVGYGVVSYVPEKENHAG